MSIQLVSKAEAMAFLVYDEEPPDIISLIEDASALVIRYLGDAATFVDSSGELDADAVPPEVRRATLVWMRQLDMDREGGKDEVENVDPKHGYGYPPLAVVRILYNMRDPVMA